MVDIIHLHRPEDGGQGPQRLNLFAGRHLGEREFDLRQAYADDRLDGLLAHRQPGIVQGLEVRRDDDDSIRVQPGIAVAADGLALRLFFPLDTRWDDILTTYRANNRQLSGRLDGFFFLALHRTVYLEEPRADQPACNRTEPDPLRDRTVETAAYLDLQPITGLPDLTGASQDRAANRICVHHLSRSPFAAGQPSLPLALVRVVNSQLHWLDPVAGRYEALPNAAHRTLLAHYQDAVTRQTRARQSGELDTPTAAASLRTHLDMDYLPSAGPLPDYLVTEIAGRPAEDADEREDWVPPQLGFRADDLQVELAPIPLSDVLPTLRREMNRQPVDLVHASEDRIRVMAAIPDKDFRANLLDLPDVDQALEAQLVARGQIAHDDYLYWRYVHDWLYADLENHVDDTKQLLTAGLTLDDADLPLVAPAPRTPTAFYEDVIEDRRALLPPGRDDLPAPYAWGAPGDVPEAFADPLDPDYQPFEGTSLYVQAELLNEKIQWLEDELDANDRLLGAFDAFLSLQRQQVDSVTLSLSNLAGGIPGDGSGLKFLKWSPFTTLKADQEG